MLQKASSAKQANEEAKELELIKLAVSTAQVEGEGNITTKNLKDELEKILGNDIKLFENSSYWYCKEYRIYKEDGKIEKGKLLPDAYQQVEYIESSGTQYVDTGIKNDINFGYIQCKFQITSLTESRYFIFGCYADEYINNENLNRLQFSFSNPYFIGIGNLNSYTNSQANSKFSKNIKNVKFSTTQCIVDDELIYTGTGYTSISNPVNIFIFANNTVGNVERKAKDIRVYSFRIYNSSNEVIRDFIPCKSTMVVTNAYGDTVTANTKGFYDLVEGKFYTNKDNSGDDFTTESDV